MPRLIYLGFIIVVLTLSGCATQGMRVWEADKIAAFSTSRVNLRTQEGIAGTVDREQIASLIDIKIRLERASSLYGVKLVIADPKEPNAFASRDSANPTIGITLGMLDLLGHDKDAYAAILSHEFAHLTLGHGAIRKEREETAKGVSAVLGIILRVAGVPMGGTISDTAVSMVTTVYSRDEERDADKKGVEYMLAAGFDPSGAIRAWERMSSARAGPLIPFLSTHPMSSERIENMKALVATINPAATQNSQASNPAVATTWTNPCVGIFNAATWTNCRGSQKYDNGNEYIGGWRNGKQHEDGAYIYADGTKFVGEWRDGRRNGKGITYAPDGSVRATGIWANDVFIQRTHIAP